MGVPFSPKKRNSDQYWKGDHINIKVEPFLRGIHPNNNILCD